jgi:large subunit ribosomal protein LP2
MKHIAAYALLVLGGKSEPTADEVSALLKEAGSEADQAKVDALVEALKGKAFNELVAEGLSKLGSMGGASAGGATVAATTEVKEDKKEEEEEVDVDMGGLFGGDDDEY